MARVRILAVGLDPAIIDFSAYPDMDAAKLRTALDTSQARLGEMGYETEMCLVDDGATAEAVLRVRLAAKRYDCIVIGAGVRMSAKDTPLFETLVNVIHAEAPQARFCFNTSPGDTVEAVQRWFPQAG